MSREEAEERRAGEGGGDFEVDGESAEGEDAFADEGGGDAELPPTRRGAQIGIEHGKPIRP